MLSRLRKQEGFTLLELLVVIVIIGILALIIVPGLASGPKRARDTQRKADLRAVKNALETYFNDSQSYPNTTYGTSDTTGLGAVLVPQYIPHLPIDPRNGVADPNVGGANYGYTYALSGTSYTLTTHLENTTDSQKTGVDTYSVSSVN